MTTITEALLAHTAEVAGIPLAALRHAASSPYGDDLDAVNDLIAFAQAATDRTVAGAALDDAIQKLVTIRHNVAPGARVRRYLPELREGLVFMDDGQRWSQQEWRRCERHPEYLVDQDGVLVDPRVLPSSLIVVPESAERVAP